MCGCDKCNREERTLEVSGEYMDLCLSACYGAHRGDGLCVGLQKNALADPLFFATADVEE